MHLSSKAKHFFTAMAQNEVCPRDEIEDPPGTAVLPIDRHGFGEGLVSFSTLCCVQSSLVRLLRIVRLPGVSHSGRHRKILIVSALRSPELSAQVRRSNSFTSYGEGVRYRRSRNCKWCVEDGGRGVCLLDVHHLVQKPVSVAQMQFTHATRSSRTRKVAGRVVCGSQVDITAGLSTRDSAATEKSFL